MNAAGSPQEQFRDCRKIPAKLRFFGNCNSHLGIVIPRTPIEALEVAAHAGAKLPIRVEAAGSVQLW